MFEWDARKALVNHKKHGVTFGEAVTVFHDPHSLVIDDLEHSCEEERAFRIGRSAKSRILTIVYTIRRSYGQEDPACRVISARQANRKEREAYYAAPARLGD